MGIFKRQDIIATKKCSCGCGGTIPLKKWHFDKGSVIPRFLLGHNPETKFKQKNKLGWKGGATECNGYRYVYSPSHPNANAMGKGYVKWSRLLMEQSLGRFLNRGEIVHHINGKRNDDRIENLEILTTGQHLSLHHKEMVKQMARDERGKFIKGGVLNG